MNQPKRIFRIHKNRILGGVCTGLGQYFQIDPIIFRLIFIVGALFESSLILLYIILWMIIPDEDHTDGTTKENISRNAKDMETKVEEITDHFGSRNNRVGWGVLLIAIACIFYFDYFVSKGIIPSISFAELWPFAILVAGLWLVYKGVTK